MKPRSKFMAATGRLDRFGSATDDRWAGLTRESHLKRTTRADDLSAIGGSVTPNLWRFGDFHHPSTDPTREKSGK